MVKRTKETIERDSLSQSYVDNQTEFLVRTRGISHAEARSFVEKTVGERVKVPRVRVVETERPGFIKTKIYPLSHFLRLIHDKVITPSGSVYCSTTKKRSIVSILIAEFMAERKKVKKKMFKAFAEGNFALGEIFQALQNSIKVTLNSLPGGYGFPSSIFYDKGSYNGITSSGRILISTAFTCCEQFLGANIPLYSVEEAINLLIMVQERGPSSADIRRVMERHNLKWVERYQITEYLNEMLKRYSFTEDLTKDSNFQRVLAGLTNEQVQFVWYHSNMQHICFDNDEYFHRHIREAFDTSFIDTDTIEFSTEIWWGLDEGILTIATTVLASEIGGMDLVKLSETPALAKKVIVVYNRIKHFLDHIEDLFSVFVYHDMIAQKVLTRSSMQRESVVVSDTDSVIYTVIQWSTWFTRQNEKVVQESYNIAALATYWLTNANADAMAKYAISSGAVGEDIDLIQMKSEFMYPALMLFDIKKVYAALTAAQEGVVFKELRPDIKGASIRGAGASPAAKKFTTEVLVDHVLKPVIEGDISARELINTVVKFEKSVKQDLASGGLDFLPMISVGTVDRYANSDQSVYFYAKAWNAIFAGKYDRVNVPNKLPKVLILKPTKQYFKWLKEKDPKIHDRFQQFIQQEGKCPSAFVVDPLCKRIPEELMPLVDVKALVYFNTNPVYLTLASLNIGIGHPRKHLLLSDIYDEE